MEAKSILLFVVILILLYVVTSYVIKDVNTLTGLVDAKTSQTIQATDLAQSDTNTSNFTYSIWFYIDDWNYKYGKEKIIFGRMTTDPIDVTVTSPCPVVSLGLIQNNIIITQTVYPGTDGGAKPNPQASMVHKCGVDNVPIQKWVNLFISVYGRSMDVYLDGKLVRTCVLPGVAKIANNAPIFITPMGGFSGFTARFQYWPESSDPQKAWDIYKKGYGGSLLGSLFGKYTINISLMQGEEEVKSLKI